MFARTQVRAEIPCLIPRYDKESQANIAKGHKIYQPLSKICYLLVTILSVCPINLVYLVESFSSSMEEAEECEDLSMGVTTGSHYTHSLINSITRNCWSK